MKFFWKMLIAILAFVFPKFCGNLAFEIVNEDKVKRMGVGHALKPCRTSLVAKKKVLTEHGRVVLEAHKIANPGMTEEEVILQLAKEQPDLWEYDGTERRRVLNREVTDVFVNDIVDSLKGDAGPYGTFDDYKYHDSGTGTNAEDQTDTALQTPWGGSRDTGTQIEGTQTYTYKSVATTTYTGSYAITEHGLFNASSGGTLMDRTVFSAINVGNGDQIEFTFEISFTAGG